MPGIAGLSRSLLLTVLVCFCLIVCLPDKEGFALSEFEQYAFPGCWGEDFPTGWITQTHLRYVRFDELFDGNGHTFDPGFKVNSYALFAKLIHVQRLNDKWQLTNALIVVLDAYVEMDNSGGSHFHKSESGIGDWISTNYIGRWWNNHMYHAGIGFSLKFPLGDYKKDRDLNIGENRYPP